MTTTPAVVEAGPPSRTQSGKEGQEAPRSAQSRRAARTGALLVSPAMTFVIAFVLFPLGFAVYISLTDWPLIGSYHWVGVSNYTQLVHDSDFLHSITFTLLYTAIVTPAIFIVGYGLAALLRANRKGAKLLRTAFFLPYVIGLTTVSYMFEIELQPTSGGVDFLLSKLGLASASKTWTIHYGSALLAICVIVTWFASGMTMLILTGGMQGISRDVYEAAEVDGATWWDKEWRITLPLLRRSIALSLVISVIGSFLAFNQFYILASNNAQLQTVVEWIYSTAFASFRVGYATAGAMFLVIIVAAITALQLFLLRDTED